MASLMVPRGSSKTEAGGVEAEAAWRRGIASRHHITVEIMWL